MPYFVNTHVVLLAQNPNATDIVVVVVVVVVVVIIKFITGW